MLSIFSLTLSHPCIDLEHDLVVFCKEICGIRIESVLHQFSLRILCVARDKHSIFWRVKFLARAPLVFPYIKQILRDVNFCLVHLRQLPVEGAKCVTNPLCSQDLR